MLTHKMYRAIAIIAFLSVVPLWADPVVMSYPMHRSSPTDNSLVDMLLTRFEMTKSGSNHLERVKAWKEYYLNDRYHLRCILHNMTPFIPLIVKNIDTYQLPGEMALIPVIVGCYRTTDVSERGAKGLWQINTITAEHLGLEQQWDYQPCFDIERSTRAALSYLADLHDRFNSWPLVLAAYNAGPSVVQKALSKGLYRSERDLENLSLPEETKDFVAKIQALAEILQHYDYYGVVVPRKADPLVIFSPKYPIDVRDLMLAFHMPLSVITQYNPAITHYQTPQMIRYQWLIPESFLAGRTADENELLVYTKSKYPVYKVQRGDNLTRIARRFGINLKQLMQHNNLQSEKIFPGQELFIPSLFHCAAPVIQHQVRPGESLWAIARLYGVKWQELQDVNLLKTTCLQPNQILIVPTTLIKK